MQHLESQVAQLETELMQDGQLEALNASNILMQMPSSNQVDASIEMTTDALPDIPNGSLVESPPRDQNHLLRKSILSSRSLQDMVRATLPYDSGAADLLSRVRMGMTPSSARVGESRTTPVNREASKDNILLKASILRSVPPEIVQLLMRKYLNTIQHDNPFLISTAVVQQFQKVAEILECQVQSQTAGDEPLPVLASHDFLLVYLVLAVSVTLGSANDGHEERCMALSVSLFEEGIQHLFSLPSFPSDIAWLQTILLVLLYATVFPRSANVWVLSGAAMRSCLELGLHREPPDLMHLDSETLDLRRRVFWAAYCMDRSICSALQRPLSTPDTAINTKFPNLAQDDTFLSSITYHRLLSEMFCVHFQREPIAPDQTWDDWLAGMENRLRSWNRSYGPASSHHETIEFTLARGIMILHRPSPRVPLPSKRSLLLAFEAASTAARIHRDHIKSGFFRRPWLSAHHTLEAATTVLFCLRHGSETISQHFSASQIFDMAKLFTSNFLAIASRGWPEVSNYASVYERLLGPLLERVFSKGVALDDRFGPAQDAELMRLLYPSPTQLEKLRFGLRQQEEELSPFDFNLFMADDGFWGGALELTGEEEEWQMARWGIDFMESGYDFGVAF